MRRRRRDRRPGCRPRLRRSRCAHSPPQHAPRAHPVQPTAGASPAYPHRPSTDRIRASERTRGILSLRELSSHALGLLGQSETLSTSTTRLRSTPIPSISHSTTSPSFSHGGGVRPARHTRRRARNNHVARLERHPGRHDLDDPPDVIQHVRRIRVLAHLAIDPRHATAHSAACEKLLGHDARPHRTARVHRLAEEPLAVVALHFTRRDVVADRVPVDMVERARRRLMRRPARPMTSPNSTS